MAGGPSLEDPLLKAKSQETARIVLCFFLLGAATDVAFNGIVLSVAFLVQKFGKDVLVLIGRPQFLGSTCTMFTLFAITLRRPKAALSNLTNHCRNLLLALVYMLCLSVAMVFVACSQMQLSAGVLQALLLANGVATGLSQSLLGVLSGIMTKFGGQPTAASAQVTGVGFGIALPTVVQLVLLPLGLPLWCAAAINYSLSMVVMVCGMVCLVLFQKTRTFTECSQKGLDEVTGKEGLTSTFAERFSWYTIVRVKQTAVPSVGLALNFAAMVYCNLLTPRLPSHGELPPAQLLPTLLIGATNSCDFLGRISTLRLLHQPVTISSNRARLQDGFQRMSFIFLWLLARLLAALGCLLYCTRWSITGRIESNGPILCCYTLGALCGGVTTVALTQYAQSLCMQRSGLNMDTPTALPCPLAGQIMLLACMVGSVFGSLTPFP